MTLSECNSTFKFDIDSVIERTGLDLDEYLEIYELFQESFQELMSELKAAMESKDTEKIMHTAHTLKGAAINMGFENLSEIAFKIQSEPGNAELVASSVPQLETLYAQVCEEVQAIADAQ